MPNETKNILRSIQSVLSQSAIESPVVLREIRSRIKRRNGNLILILSCGHEIYLDELSTYLEETIGTGRQACSYCRQAQLYRNGNNYE